jgi:hypothetical protein
MTASDSPASTDRRCCLACGADVIGNDPHAVNCPADPENPTGHRNQSLTSMGEARCREHHAESWWYNDKRCERRAGHGGNHVISTPTSYTPWAQEKGA